METGIYLRVSTEEQAQDGFSIRGQEQKLKDYARIKDWSVYRVYADEGISGKNITGRPAMNELIEDIKREHVKNVLVFKIDRLTRSTADLIYLVDLFNNHGCAFNSLMESIDTQTASGRMFLKIIGIFAEFERENIVERVKLGFERKVKEGYCLSTHISSYGYTRKKGEKIQQIDPEEAETVRKVFDMYVNQGFSLLKIAETLNALKVPTKLKKSNSGWAVMTVRNILTNCNLIGNVRHHCANGTSEHEWEGLHEPIISQELYDEAQQLLEKKRRISKTKHSKDENYFTGILTCKICGRNLTTHNYPRKLVDGSISYRRSYRCGNKILKLCDSSEVGHAQAEQAFQDYMSTIEELAMPNEIQQGKEQKTQERSKQIPVYEDKLRQLETKENEILNRYVDNEIDFEVYKKMTKRIEHEKAIIQSELAQLTQSTQSEATIEREDIIREPKENWLYLTDKEKRQFLVKFVKSIVIQNEKEQKIKTRGKTKIFDVEFYRD